MSESNVRWPLEPLHAYVAAQHGLMPHRATGGCPGCHDEVGWEYRNCLSLKRLGQLCGGSERSGSRWAQNGLRTNIADRAAIAVGSHPTEIWEGWYD